MRAPWLLLLVLLIGCEGNDGSTGEVQTSTSSEGSTSDAQTGPGAASAKSDEETGYAGDLGPCGRLIGCVETQDSPITPLLAAYGRDGTCWAEFPAEACWQDCGAMLNGYASECGDTTACCECESDDDCEHDPATPRCILGSCVDPDEPGLGCALVHQCPADSDDAEYLQYLCTEGFQCFEALDAAAWCAFEANDQATACASLEACIRFDCASVPGCATEGAAQDECA